MLRTLQVEWMKVKGYRTFWILLAITIVSIPAFNYMLYNIMGNTFPKKHGIQTLFGSPFAFPDAWQTVSWNASILFLIPAILIITLTTNEFVYKTHRQNVIDGWSRGQFISVKLVEVLLLSILSTVVVILTALGFGLLANKLPQGVSVWQESRFVGFFFVQMLSYSLIAFLLGLFIKRAGLAMGLFFIYMIIEEVIVGIFQEQISYRRRLDYLPEEVTDKLIPFPYVKNILVQQGTGTGNTIYRSIYWLAHSYVPRSTVC